MISNERPKISSRWISAQDSAGSRATRDQESMLEAFRTDASGLRAPESKGGNIRRLSGEQESGILFGRPAPENPQKRINETEIPALALSELEPHVLFRSAGSKSLLRPSEHKIPGFSNCRTQGQFRAPELRISPSQYRYQPDDSQHPGSVRRCVRVGITPRDRPQKVSRNQHHSQGNPPQSGGAKRFPESKSQPKNPVGFRRCQKEISESTS